MDDLEWSFIKQNTTVCSASNSQLCTALEGLALDLEVVSADLEGSQGLLSSIVKRLQVLEQLRSERESI